MRISVFIDGANVFYMQRERLRWWIDFRKLLDYIRSKGDVIDANTGRNLQPSD